MHTYLATNCRHDQAVEDRSILERLWQYNSIVRVQKNPLVLPP